MLKKREYLFWVTLFYGTALLLLCVGTVYDLQIDCALYHPENPFARFLQDYGEVPRFALWGPAAAVLYATREWECEKSVALFGFFRRKKGGLSEKAKSTLYNIANWGFGIGFLVLGFFSWQKLIKNVVKHWFSAETKETLFYTVFLITVILAVDVLAAYFTKRKVSAETLRALKPLAYGGIFFGILYRVGIDPIKNLVQRTRFYEMLTVYEDSAFTMFTPWFKKGCGGSSFPSGHTASGATLFLSLTLCDTVKRFQNKERLFFLLSWGYTWLLGFTRLIMGRHFLSDITVGAVLGFTFALLAREVFVRRFSKKVGLYA